MLQKFNNGISEYFNNATFLEGQFKTCTVMITVIGFSPVSWTAQAGLNGECTGCPEENTWELQSSLAYAWPWPFTASSPLYCLKQIVRPMQTQGQEEGIPSLDRSGYKVTLKIMAECANAGSRGLQQICNLLRGCQRERASASKALPLP